MHTGPKANTNKTQTSRFTWFPKIGYVHRGSRLYIIGGMIQTLNSTQYNPTKTQCFTLTLVSLKFALALTLTVALSSSLSAHTCTVSALSIPLSFLSVYIRKESINIVAEKERVVDGC